METNTKNRKMVSIDTTYANDGDVFNGDKIINNYIVLPSDEFYHTLTKKNNYAEFYKKYILCFKELDNYAIDALFPYPGSKQYDFSDEKLIFGKKIINWILGTENFPQEEIRKFYSIIKKDFELPDDSILVKRWAANNYYFEGKYDEANKGYSALYDDIIGRKDIPTWYIDDICIDGRNFLIESKKEIDILKNKYHIRLSSIEHKLSHPDIDRVKVEIYEKVQKIVFNNKNKGKYTSFFGIGLEECLSQIQDLIYMTIFYGSITHLRIIRNLIANVMYMYAETFDDKDFYALTLKMLYLSGDNTSLKRFSSLHEKIILKQRFVNDKDFIYDLIKLNNSLFDFEQEIHEIFIFEKYGYYLDDDYYCKLETKCMSILNSENADSNMKIACLDAFKKNMSRTSKTTELMDFIIMCFRNNRSLYYPFFGIIINSIDISKLDKKSMKKMNKILHFSLQYKNYINYDISHCIVDFKKYNPKEKQYDKLITSDDDKLKLIYMIENGTNTLEVVKRIVEILKDRHEYNEKNPGISRDYMDNYRIGIDVFESEKFNEDLKMYFESEFIPFARDFLLSENETLSDKINIIKLLVHLLKKDYSDNTKKDIMDLISACENVKYKNGYRLASFKECTIEDLKINIMMAKTIYGDLPFDDFLIFLNELLISNSDSFEEILTCILNGKMYLELNEQTVNYLFLLGKKGFVSDDYEIKNLAVELFSILLSTNENKKILELLYNDCPNISLKEFRGYYQLLIHLDEDLKKDLKELVNLLKQHNNYLIRKISVNNL